MLGIGRKRSPKRTSTMFVPAEPALSISLTSHISHLKRTALTSQLKVYMDKDVVVAVWAHDVRLLGGISFILLRVMSVLVKERTAKARVSYDMLKQIGQQ